MPAQPTWFQRLPQILATLGEMTCSPYLDRQAFERLFSVRDRRARALMAGMEGIQVGNAWVVDRLKLIASLERIQRGEAFPYEQRRRERVTAADESRPNASTPPGKCGSRSRKRSAIPAWLPCLRVLNSGRASCEFSLPVPRILPPSSSNCRKPWRTTGELSCTR